MAIRRVLVEWQGIATGPGVNVLHTPNVDGPWQDIIDFYTAIAGMIPNSVDIVVPNEGPVIDETTGAQTGAWTNINSPATIAGLGVGTHAAGVGVAVNWLTGDFVGGRRVRGRTFIAPIDTAAMEGDGTLVAADLATLRAAATDLASGGATDGIVVWHRPTAPGNGSSHLVTTAQVSDRVAYLGSRRS